MPHHWSGRVVLVTGATGLLGSWLTRSLLEDKATVVALVRDWTPQSEFIRQHLMRRCQVVRGDVTDRAIVERTLGEYEVDTVFHLAAQTIVGIANRNPISTFETNIAGTYRLLEACRRTPTVKSIVVASSDKAYGQQEELPYTEDARLEGRHPYDVSKSCADLIAKSYAHTYNLPVVITRCGNLYGGGDLNWNRIVPGTIRSISLGQRPVVRSDGSPKRDYLYVEDAVNGYRLAAEKMANDPSLAGEAFNFSPGAPLQAIEIVNLILRLMESRLKPKVLATSRNEIHDQYLTSFKASSRLGWRAKHSMIEGLRKTIAWYEELLDDRGVEELAA